MFFPRRTSIRRNASARRGAIAILVAFSLAVILAFLAISVDGGGLLEKRRHNARPTADAAAMAAARKVVRLLSRLPRPGCRRLCSQSGLRDRSLNGFNNDDTTSVVTVRTSPQTYSGGPNAGMPLPNGYAEVSVQHNQKRPICEAYHGNGKHPVQARAVARGNWEAADVAMPPCLDLHKPASLTSTGES